MKVRHGGFAIDIPSGWSDQSTLLFVGPRDRTTLPATHKVSPPAEAVAVTFAGPSEDARALLEEQAEMLRAADADFEVLEEGPFECELGHGHRFVQKLDAGGTKIQIAVAVPAHGATVIATATCAQERYGKVQEQLLRVLGSMTAEGGGS
jgi:hypothetical protein